MRRSIKLLIIGAIIFCVFSRSFYGIFRFSLRLLVLAGIVIFIVTIIRSVKRGRNASGQSTNSNCSSAGCAAESADIGSDSGASDRFTGATREFMNSQYKRNTGSGSSGTQTTGSGKAKSSGTTGAAYSTGGTSNMGGTSNVGGASNVGGTCNSNDAYGQVMTDVRTIAATNNSILDLPVRSRGYEVLNTIRSIVQEHFREGNHCREFTRFSGYYLPTLRKALENFRNMESKNVLTDKVRRDMVSYLDSCKEAFTKIYTNMFEDDRTNLEVQIEAMNITMKRDGLL